MTTDDWLACIVCRLPVDASGPAVCQYEGRSGDTEWGWVAFVEDWRGGRVDLIHGACFANTHGPEALVAAVHARDLIERGEIPRLMAKVDDLRQQLKTN